MSGWLARLWAWLTEPPERRRETDDDDDGEAPDEPAPMPIEDALDLHAFQPREVASVVEEYLFEARRRGFREVRVVHGKGKGVLRRVVHGVLARHPAVASYRDAGPREGAWGATMVSLAPVSAPPAAPRRAPPGRPRAARGRR